MRKFPVESTRPVIISYKQKNNNKKKREQFQKHHDVRGLIPYKRGQFNDIVVVAAAVGRFSVVIECRAFFFFLFRSAAAYFRSTKCLLHTILYSIVRFETAEDRNIYYYCRCFRSLFYPGFSNSTYLF